MSTTADEFENRYRKALMSDAQALAAEPRAAHARYDTKARRLVIELTNGVTLVIPPSLLQDLRGANARKLSDIEVTPDGYGLHWRLLDADLSVPGLVTGMFGSRAWMRSLGAHGGRVTTAAKAAAARSNGRLGGRPRQASGE